MATLTLVTISFNNLEEVKTTMQSVFDQSRQPDEYWIIDGSSNTEIKDYLHQADFPSFVSWISERDKGISDGFNKGVSRAKMDVVHILNSGDYYASNTTIEEVMALFDQDPTLMWVHGRYQQYLGSEWIISGKKFNPEKLYMGMRQVAHPTMFVKREVYDRIGLFPVDMRDAMDFDFLIRIRKEKFQYLETVLSVFTPGGNSEVNWKRTFKEGMKIYQNHLGNDWRLQLGYVKQLLVHAILDSPFGSWMLSSRKK